MFVVGCGGSGMFDCGGVMMVMRRRASMIMMIVEDRGMRDPRKKQSRISGASTSTSTHRHSAIDSAS